MIASLFGILLPNGCCTRPPLTGRHPAVAVADAEAAAELAKEEHELGRTPERGEGGGKSGAAAHAQRTKKENNATRFPTP